MALSDGVRLGVYEIRGSLGAGGMGVVYRAWDTRLRREVALKLLSDITERDETARVQLLHEARAAAPLNHPHICTIYEVGEVEETPFIAMELVKGETLQAIVARGPLLLTRVYRLGQSMADALEHAHAHGVIHRDFKSANVMITTEGRVKVLDFGIAHRAPRASDDATPTETIVESTGTVAGTLAYMAPELLQGRVANVRSDIWALGVVLYEMACGKPPFGAGTVSQLSAAILRDPVNVPQPATPAGLARIIHRCLAKEPADRFARAGEVAAALEVAEASIAHGGPTDVAGTPEIDSDERQRVRVVPPPATRWLTPALAIAATAAAASLLGWTALRDRTAPPALAPTHESAVQLTHFATSAREPAISADGRLLAFIVQEPRSLTTQLYVKTLPDGRPTQLTRSPGAKAWPAFSPDGRRIAYTVTGEERKWDTWVVEVTGGTPQLMLRNANSLRWLKDGRVLFSEFKTGAQLGVARADEGRGDHSDVYVPPGQGMAHYSDLSPDGTHVLIGEMFASQTTQGGTVRTRCFVMPIAGGPERTVTSDATPCIQFARWAPDGRYMYFVSGAPGNYQVWRQPAAGGQAEQVTTGPSMFLRGVVPGGFALSPDGTTLVSSIGETQESLWLRRGDGGEAQLTFEGDARNPSVSDDGRRVFYISGPRFRPGPIRMRRIDSDEDRPLATGRVALAVWSAPDGERFVFTSLDADGRIHLWLGTTDNSAAPRQLTSGEGSEIGAVFGRGGASLYFAQNRERDAALWSLDIASGELKQISEPAGRLVPVSLSPDGRWLSVMRTDLTPRETWLYPTTPGVPPRRLYTSWRFEWAPGNRAFLVSNSGMISSAWSIPNPGGATFPPPFKGEPTTDALEQMGARRVVLADFFVDPTPLPEAFSIIYSHVEGRSNLFQIPVAR